MTVVVAIVDISVFGPVRRTDAGAVYQTLATSIEIRVISAGALSRLLTCLNYKYITQLRTVRLLTRDIDIAILSVCLSVRLSRCGIVLKRLNTHAHTQLYSTFEKAAQLYAKQ